jgi:hypothetical protein
MALMFYSLKGSGAAPHTVPPLHATLDNQLPIRLREHVQRLKLIIPVISVSVMALRRQNAELDEDIASILHLHASGPLDEEVEDLETLLEHLGASARDTQRAREAS